MAGVRDFIYLDLPRLQSFASQLLEGLPEAETHTRGHSADFAGEVRAGLPGVLGATANTKAVMSAQSSVTSTVHHRLVGLVVDELVAQRFLVDPDGIDAAPDGSFVILQGQLQVTDPAALRVIFEDWRNIETWVAALTAGPTAAPPQVATKADRRAGRQTASSSFPQPYLDALVGTIRRFAEASVRIRLVDGGESVAVCVAERDKFVEDLDRLTARHGFVMSGPWELLGQINVEGSTEAFTPESTDGIVDMIEATALDVVIPFASISSASGAAGGGRSVTPLAIYRMVNPGPT